MTVNVLGISGLFHDSAAAITRDGEIVAAAQEERFSRAKHDLRFPRQAINYCLGEAFLEADQLDAVVFYDDPLITLDRVLKCFLTIAPNGIQQWLKLAPSALGVRPYIARQIRETLKANVPVLFTRHHLAHAASAFYPSPFEEAAILTVDGVGEWATTSIAFGRGEDIRVKKEIHYPHSLGLLYSAFTYFCGFRVNYDEHKLMGLAPYGKPRYADRIWQHLLQRKADGSFRLNTCFFGYLESDRMTNAEFERLFDGPRRTPGSEITRREMDLAASVQEVVAQVLMGLARHAKEITGAESLVVAGGVALNCAAMGLLCRERIFRRLWIQPAAGDAGGAIGAALLASYVDFGVRRRVDAGGGDSQKGSYLGPEFSSAEVRAFLDRGQYPYEIVEDSVERSRRVARTLAEGGIVGYFSGRMEFGPRALGARSILADPRRLTSHLRINLKTKRRESFRPLAPTVLLERSEDYFEISEESPYMLLVVPVLRERQLVRDSEASLLADEDLLGLIQHPRSDIPAVTHVDYGARIQTISKHDNPNYYQVLKDFEEITGCGVIVNTSFNTRGEPIVCTPSDAYRCFMDTDMDLLVMEDCVIEKAAAVSRGKPEVFLEFEATHCVGVAGPDERALCDFFFQELVPAAEDLRRKKVSFVSLGADDPIDKGSRESWYVNCSETIVKLERREPEDLGSELLQIWAPVGVSALSNLVEPLVALSQELEPTDYSHRARPAPFVYAMY